MFSASAFTSFRRRRIRSRNGISLLECLLSFAVLGIATAMLMQLVTTRLGVQEYERKRLQSQLKLENFRERLVHVPYAEFEGRVNELKAVAKKESIRLDLNFFDQSDTSGWHLQLEHEQESPADRSTLQLHLRNLKPVEVEP